MTVVYEVWIGERAHQVKIAMPDDGGEELRLSVQKFAISTAFLEHLGCLPKGVLSAVV